MTGSRRETDPGIDPLLQRIIRQLKRIFKARGLRYADVGEHIGVSEKSIKRYMSGHGLSLPLLEKLCAVGGITFLELAHLVASEEPFEPLPSTELQEQAMINEPKVGAVFALLNTGWNVKQIIREFSVDESEMNALLTRLDSLRIIDLFPGNRVRILIGIRRFEHCTPILRKSIVRNALDVTEAVSHLQKDAFCKMEFLRLGPASLARARALTDAYFDQLIALAKRDLDIVGDQARWYSTASCFAPSSPRGMEKLKESSRTVAARST